eukprot:11213436-Lingulodinium_polyedra.AAC.1
MSDAPSSDERQRLQYAAVHGGVLKALPLIRAGRITHGQHPDGNSLPPAGNDGQIRSFRPTLPQVEVVAPSPGL